MVRPPLEAGRAQVTVAEASPGTALTFRGLSGTNGPCGRGAEVGGGGGGWRLVIATAATAPPATTAMVVTRTTVLLQKGRARITTGTDSLGSWLSRLPARTGVLLPEPIVAGNEAPVSGSPSGGSRA